MLESATAFAQQAKAAGVTIKVDNGPTSSYFGPKYLKQNFAQTQWPAFALYSWYQQAMAPNAPFNETHWKDAKWSKLYNQAQATVDDAKRKDLNFELQRILWDRGGYLIWGFYPLLDGIAKNVRGAVGEPQQRVEQLQLPGLLARVSGVARAGSPDTGTNPLEPAPPAVRLGSSHPVLGFLVRRALLAIVTLFAISILIFAGTAVLPGDAANAILGRNATPDSLAALREQLHLNQSVVEQYWHWIVGVVARRFRRLRRERDSHHDADRRAGEEQRDPGAAARPSC